jgi:D-glycero-D-manno-heptose 1,7-bisphosphate phosphatase
MGMLDIIAKHLTWDVNRSVVIGDKRSDLDLAVKAGLKPILVRTGYGMQTESNVVPPETAIYDDLATAISSLLESGDD